MARKGKFAEWLTPDGLTVIEGWARDGLTDEQTAHNMGISYTTLKDWINKFPAISTALKKGKAPVDIQVENALLKRALGYEYEETITEMEEVSGGKPKKHIRKVTKHMPPDTTAQIFWLKNRRPDRWRDKIENVQTVGNELLESLMRLERSAGHD
ncbi:MAG: helix-turn-helix domain-containing protein [Lentisphaeria bacterium]|nr:helix-turn-helix domain-containing protein [Lentisphaeria bacterium]